MEEDVLATNDNPGKKVHIWWLVALPLGIIVLAIVFWTLLYSVNLANNTSIIPLRSSYQEAYWKVEGVFLTPKRPMPPFDPIYPLQVEKSNDDDYYTYSLWGISTEVDMSSRLFYIEGYDNNRYVFKIKSYAYTTTVGGGKTQPFSTGKIYKVSWQDKRSLAQIKEDYTRDKLLPLNQESPKSAMFAEYD